MTQASRVFTYSYLLMAAKAARHRALHTEPPDDPFVEHLSTVLYCALTLEAFMNHVGMQVLPAWQEQERLDPKKKLEALATHGKFSISWGIRPYQSFTCAFSFRKLVVHGKTQDIPHKGRAADDWRGYCTRERAGRILDDTVAILESLPGQLRLEPIPAFVLDLAVTAET